MSINEPSKNNKPTKSSLERIFRNTTFLTLGIPAIGFVILFIGAFITTRIENQRISDFYSGLVMIFTIPWFILGCIFVILRKEIPRPGISSIKGLPAVIQGVVGVLILSIVEIYIIYLTIFDKY